MKPKATIKWRSILGLILVYMAMWYNWQWIWGVLFLLWVIPDIFSGVTYFIEPIARKEHPILYWLILSSWILMSIYTILPLFIPELKYY